MIDVDAFARTLIAELWQPPDANHRYVNDDEMDSLLIEIVTLRERVAEQAAIIEGLEDVIAGRVKPISQLWDELDADEQREG